jgi:hypothetical protein
MGNQQGIPNIEIKENLVGIRKTKIKLVDLERLHYFFEENNEVNHIDKYYWYYLLCQTPDYINIEIKDNYIINICQKINNPGLRIVNYMYDIYWDENINQEDIEEIKNKVKFWISGDLCDIWEALGKICIIN